MAQKRQAEDVCKRKSIPFFTNFLDMIMMLPNEQLGELIRLCYQYTKTGETPEELTSITDMGVLMGFQNFKLAEDANFKEWQAAVKQRKINRNVGTIKKLRSEGLSDDDILALYPNMYDILAQIPK